MSQQVLNPPPPKRKTKGESARGPGARRPTLPAAHGEPMIWVMGAGLVLALCMIVGMFTLIIGEGLVTFWPDPIDRVTLMSGQVFLGVPVKTDEENGRELYHVGNFDAGGQPFQWVDFKDVAKVERPTSAVMLQRPEWGIWLGEPKGVVLQDDLLLSPEQAKEPAPATSSTEWGNGRVERQVLGEEDGKVHVRQRTILAEDPAQAKELLEKLQPLARARASKIEGLTKHSLGNINHEIEASRLDVRKAEIESERGKNAPTPMLSWLGVVVVLAGIGACLLGFVRLGRGKPGSLTAGAVRSGVRALLLIFAIVGVLLAVLENPKGGPHMPAEKLASIRQASTERIAQLDAQYKAVQAQIVDVDQLDRRFRALVVEPSGGRFSPVRQSEPDEPMRVSQIVRMIPANDLSWTGKLGVYFSRWWEYLSDDPRDANTEGGVFPVIFGTVALTLLLSIVVVPLGVIAALYLREYAKQGPLVSLIRIAVNNLAGIPSIVYGVFGYGFFLGTVGGFVDHGTASPARSSLVVGCRRRRGDCRGRCRTGIPGQRGAGLEEAFKTAGPDGLCLARCRVARGLGRRLDAVLQRHVPGEASLTDLRNRRHSLGLIDPGHPDAAGGDRRYRGSHRRRPACSVREGSYGCGASKWQTVRRIVLPQALPGIMTGGILAMARGARRGGPADAGWGRQARARAPRRWALPVHPPRAQLHAPWVPHLRPRLPEPQLRGGPPAGVDNDAPAGGDCAGPELVGGGGEGEAAVQGHQFECVMADQPSKQPRGPEMTTTTAEPGSPPTAARRRSA